MNQYERKKIPPAMRFQARDGEILKAIHDHDGLLARRQIKELFWANASQRAMGMRLSVLYHNHFLAWASPEQRRLRAIPEPLVWLGWRGILYLANLAEVDIPEPGNHGENQMRLLEKRLRKAGIRWQREPRWSQLSHDIAVNDFRLAVEGAASYWPSLELEEWLAEGDFLTDMDVISISKKRKKGIRPDGFFVLVDHMRKIQHSPARGRFLLELDNGTHPVTRFGRDKALPGIKYLRSAAYKKRFGFNSGRWLVVAQGKQRLSNLKDQTEKILGKDASVFFFTTLEQVQIKTVLNSPIWLRGGSDTPEQLVRTIR